MLGGKAHAVVCPNNIQIRVSLANHRKKNGANISPTESFLLLDTAFCNTLPNLTETGRMKERIEVLRV